MPEMLTILHAPNHGPSLSRPILRKLLGLARAHHVDSIGFTEAYRRNWYLHALPNWRLIVGHSRTDKRRGAKDNPVLVARRNKVTSWSAWKTCKAVKPVKWNPERWLTRVVYRHPFGVVEHICVHPNPNIVGRPETAAHVAAYIETMTALENTINRARKARRLVVVTGDLNCPVVAEKGAKPWYPQRVFARTGLKYVNHRIDYIGYDRRLDVHTTTVIPPAEQGRGQDHPWIIAALVKAPSKPKPTPAERVIALAKSQVGYHEGYRDGHWDNIEKYAGQVPGLGWAQGQPWCDVFVAWCFTRTGLGDLIPISASCAASKAAWIKRGRWSEYPAIGAQVIFGNSTHTGIVAAYDDTTITTVEGNTNTSGSPEGDGVYLKTHLRRDPWVTGYGYPAYREGIRSADPAWKNRK